MLITEGGATGGDRGGDPGHVHGHHVGVALHDDGLVGPGDVPLGHVDSEQHRGLLVDHGLRGVDVLGLDLVIVEDPAGAEAHRLATGAADGPQQPPVEAVHRAATAFPGQPGSLEFLELEALADQVFGQRVPARRGEAAAELGRRSGVEVAFGEIAPRRCGLLGFQCGGIEFLRGGVGGGQSAATAAVALHGVAAAGVGDRVADSVGEHLDRLDEADVFDLLHEGEDVPALAAAEAVEVSVVGPHMERR